MKIFKNALLYGFLFLSTLTVFSQSKITGIVIDQELNQPLAGASVVVKGTTTGEFNNLMQQMIFFYLC